MKRFLSLMVALTLLFALCACASEQTVEKPAVQPTGESAEAPAKTDGEPILIGIAESAMDHQFRVKQVEDNEAYAEKNFPSKYEFMVTNANSDVSKQVKDIEDHIAAGVDVIMVSPLSADGLNTVLQQAMDAGIKVVTMDSHASLDVDLHVGSSDYDIGKAVAKALCDAIGDEGSVIEIQGTAGTTATTDRNAGFRDELANHPNVTVIEEQYCDYKGTLAMTYMEDMLTKYDSGEIDAVYAHNDQMSMAAAQAIAAAGRTGEIAVFGIDGENAAFELINQGILTGSAVYSFCAPEGIIAVDQMLSGELTDKEVIIPSVVVTADNVAEYLGKGF